MAKSNARRSAAGRSAPSRKSGGTQGAGFSSFDGSTFFDDTEDRKIQNGTVDEVTSGEGLAAVAAILPDKGLRAPALVADRKPAQVTVTVEHRNLAGADAKPLGPVSTPALAGFFVAQTTVVLTMKPGSTTKRRLNVIALLVKADNMANTAIRRVSADEA